MRIDQPRAGVTQFILSFKGEMIKRVDPAGCGCTDCLVGEYSKPEDQLTDRERGLFLLGELQDATR